MPLPLGTKRHPNHKEIQENYPIPILRKVKLVVERKEAFEAL